jgi:hypothetical protein
MESVTRDDSLSSAVAALGLAQVLENVLRVAFSSIPIILNTHYLVGLGVNWQDNLAKTEAQAGKN